MPLTGPSEADTGQVPHGGRYGSSLSLLLRARLGDTRAIAALFERHLGPLRRWAAGRLPRWARGLLDTADVVQDAMLQTLRQLQHFEPRGRHALEAYLRQAIHNRIRDELRRVTRVPMSPIEEDFRSNTPSPFEETKAAETTALYRQALLRLRADDRDLIVGRLELDYSYEQLAVATGRATPAAARVAAKRALGRLAIEMSNAARATK